MQSLTSGFLEKFLGKNSLGKECHTKKKFSVSHSIKGKKKKNPQNNQTKQSQQWLFWTLCIYLQTPAT